MGKLAAIIAGGAVAGLTAFGLTEVTGNVLGIPGLEWDGGETEPAPRGDITPQAQIPQTAVEDFVYKIGTGTSVIAVKATQQWDKPGNVFSGDWVSDNGTASVADPEDRDEPANLEVEMSYCVDGSQEAVYSTDPDTQERTLDSITFRMGTLMVCDAVLRHTPENDAAFKQSDTPQDFQGDFTSFVAGAVETAAVAQACPADLEETYTTAEYITFVEQAIADKNDLPITQVHVVPPRVGVSSTQTQDELNARLDSYANKQDPDDPGTTHESLDFGFLGQESAVVDSCYAPLDTTNLGDLASVVTPQPLTPTQPPQ